MNRSLLDILFIALSIDPWRITAQASLRL